MKRAVARITARIGDAAMCAMMYALQRRHRLTEADRAAWEKYVKTHEGSSRADHFHGGPMTLHPATSNGSTTLRWNSPITTRFEETNRVHVDLYECSEGAKAPTVLMLHALMSASDAGYRRWARDFNARGWNAAFVHLPFHYSRTPRRHFNGELAITADLVRTAEGLRSGVTELRQLMAHLRERGTREFGLWACSYGGWIGALLASVEADFRFVALMEPIVDVDHAIWVSPAGLALRRELSRHAIPREFVARHFPLASPMYGMPLGGADRVLFCAGEFDQIAAASDIEALHRRWPGSDFLTVPQGHFGYKMMRETWRRLIDRGLL